MFTKTSLIYQGGGVSKLKILPVPIVNKVYGTYWRFFDQLNFSLTLSSTGMYLRKTGEDILDRHPCVLPKMRSILLDWLVCLQTALAS
jgi:hypothetical protein